MLLTGLSYFRILDSYLCDQHSIIGLFLANLAVPTEAALEYAFTVQSIASMSWEPDLMKMPAADGTLPAPVATPRRKGNRKASDKPKLNKVEILKLEKSPLSLIHDIYRWADEGFDAIPPDYYDLFKWHGFFYRKQTPGYFMLRMRISNGVINSMQLRAIARLARDFGRGVGDLTTRQNIQLRWITVEDMPAIIETLQSVGLGSEQTGMDNFRNVTGCPLTGLTEHELLATRQLTTATALSLLGPAFENIPRKFNISIQWLPTGLHPRAEQRHRPDARHRTHGKAARARIQRGRWRPHGEPESASCDTA